MGLAEECSFSFLWTSLPTATAAAPTDIAALAFATSHAAFLSLLILVSILMYHCNKRGHLNSYLKHKTANAELNYLLNYLLINKNTITVSTINVVNQA